MAQQVAVPGIDSLAPRERTALRGLVVHRIEVSQEDPSYQDHPLDVARFFREHPVGKTATGGSMPYPVLIAVDGTVSQTVPLLRTTPHARSHNPTTIGVALLGDFRSRAPSAAQRQALVVVCADLLAELGLPADAIFGHDELQGGSSDPEKECPGRHLPLPSLRADVARQLSSPRRYRFIW